MNEALIPKLTRPITAYALLSKICKLITEEPKRYNQGSWIIDATRDISNPNMRPACGTVCCVAGWVGALTKSPAAMLRLYKQDETRFGSESHVSEFARTVLGLSYEDASELFDADAVENICGWRNLPDVGTPEYAACGVQHIRAFQKKHADQLKAKVVRPEKKSKA